MTPADRIRRDLRNLFGPDSVQERDLNEALEDIVDTPVPVARPENEAAERLRDWILDSKVIGGEARPLASLDAALATERRLTVERISAAINLLDWTEAQADSLSRILDEEADR